MIYNIKLQHNKVDNSVQSLDKYKESLSIYNIKLKL